MGFPAKIVDALPEGVRQFIRKQYYPRVLLKYTADQWEYATVVKNYIPEGGCVVDAGANVGYLSHLFSLWVGAPGHVHSFEPVPWTFDILQSNARKLGLKNMSVYNLALSERAGTAVMQIPTYADGRENLYESRITEEADTALRTVEVKLNSLDDLLLAKTTNVDFIKIDVEGHELEVVTGAKKLLMRDQPPLLIEVSGPLADDEEAAGQLRLMLAGLGYAPHVLRKGLIEPWDGVEVCVDYLFLCSEMKNVS